MFYTTTFNLLLQSTGPVFKIEPLLRRNAPSVELASQVAQNAARATIVARIIAQESVMPAHFSYACTQPLDDCPRVPPFLCELYVFNVKFELSMRVDTRTS